MSCVLTLALDNEAQSRFEALRQQYFPAERNQIPAHLTLFHTLPEDDGTERLLSQTAAAQVRFAMQVAEVRSIGRGVAYFLSSREAAVLHRALRDGFGESVSPQDRQGFRPHVVVQNKVTGEAARATLALLQPGFTPWPVQAVGLDLWRYLGGPWQHLRRFQFV